ncbi:MAG: aminotransferase class I/II-fold pyridoxal phosphate-dependent enzyme [Crenarchaeota archaeon]|nr:aminotransferase class I/II-fold pyridoxal phosphate-dependent enzyme [Thermoproteota archaeon]MDW8033497.1 aminotransferase class I/II-fold pyridoxal phosphate-dependent enzyme [Nitrososphaerota archaeon]
MTFPLIRLDTNENPYGASPKAMIAYLRYAGKMNRYPDYEEYKSFLSSRIGLESENILPVPGSDRGLQILLQYLAKRYERVVIPSPSFLMYTKFSRLCFRNVEHIACWLGRDWDGVLSRSGTDAVLLLGSPNNPTGEVIKEGLVKRLLNEFGIVVVDEAYYEYYGVSMIPLLRDFENIVVVRTFSKAYGLAGLRSGYLVGSRRLIKEVNEYTGPFDIPAPAVEASKAALQDEDWLKTVVEKTIANRTLLLRDLKSMDGVYAYDSKANYVLIRVNDAKSVFEKLLSNRIIVRLVTPEWGGTEESFLRVTVGALREVNLFTCALRNALRN